MNHPASAQSEFQLFLDQGTGELTNRIDERANG